MSEDTPTQRIKISGKFYVILPATEYETLMRSVSELSDCLRFPVDALLASPVIGEGESRLRAWRKHRGLTLETLASMVGGHKVGLSDMERGKRNGTMKNWRKIADALNVSLDDILPLD